MWRNSSSTIRSRFNHLLLEHEEYALIDISAKYIPPLNDNVQFDPVFLRSCCKNSTANITPISGRLKLCTKSVFFDPDENNLPIIRIPLKYIESISRTFPKSPYLSQLKILDPTSVFCIAPISVSCMKVNNKPVPYSHFTKNPGSHLFSIEKHKFAAFYTPLQELIAATLSTNGPEYKQSKINSLIQNHENNLPFQRAWFTDSTENVLTLVRSKRLFPLVELPGRLAVTQKRIYFQLFSQPGLKLDSKDNESWSTKFVRLNNHNMLIQIFNIDSIIRIKPRIYLADNTGIEIFFTSNNGGASVYFIFSSERERNQVYDLLSRSSRKNNFLKNLSWTKDPKTVTLLWQHELISTFEYLIYVNDLAGRSFNDLSQYPVFPWILSDYSSRSLSVACRIDPNNPKISPKALEALKKVFRDLSKPIGAIESKRLANFEERRQVMSETIDPLIREKTDHLYSVHYSTAAYVLFYLIREVPDFILKLQTGKFDRPDRLFHSLKEVWMNVSTSPTDLKELIPEFFTPSQEALFGYRKNFCFKQETVFSYISDPSKPPIQEPIHLQCPSNLSDPLSHTNAQTMHPSALLVALGLGNIVPKNHSVTCNFLSNTLNLQLGIRQSDKSKVDHVVLPPWGNSPSLFLHTHWTALESAMTSNSIHHWIDLVFGYKTRGEEAKKSLNTFHPLTYPEIARKILLKLDQDQAKSKLTCADIESEILNCRDQSNKDQNSGKLKSGSSNLIAATFGNIRRKPHGPSPQEVKITQLENDVNQLKENIIQFQLLKESCQAQIREFGQVPGGVFVSPHCQRIFGFLKSQPNATELSRVVGPTTGISVVRMASVDTVVSDSKILYKPSGPETLHSSTSTSTSTSSSTPITPDSHRLFPPYSFNLASMKSMIPYYALVSNQPSNQLPITSIDILEAKTGTIICSSSADGKMSLYSVARSKPSPGSAPLCLRRIRYSTITELGLVDAKFLPLDPNSSLNSAKIVCATGDSKLVLCNANTCTPHSLVSTGRIPLRFLEIENRHNDPLAMVGTTAGVVQIWNLSSCLSNSGKNTTNPCQLETSPVQKLNLHQHPVCKGKWSPSDSWCGITGDLMGNVASWDLRQTGSVFSIKPHVGSISALSFSPCGGYFMTAGQDNNVLVFDMRMIKSHLSSEGETSISPWIKMSTDETLFDAVLFSHPVVEKSVTGKISTSSSCICSHLFAPSITGGVRIWNLADCVELPNLAHNRKYINPSPVPGTVIKLSQTGRFFCIGTTQSVELYGCLPKVVF